jgi:hypothetical protein
MNAQQLTPYVSRLVESDYAQDNLRDAVDNLRAAYERASKQKAAKAADDKKLYAQVRQAVASLKAAALAIFKGQEKPKRKWPKRLALLALIAAGAAAASQKTGQSTDEPIPTA